MNIQELAYDEKGKTKYYEYGRYDSNFGQVKNRIVPDLTMDKEGKPTEESWEKLMKFLSKKYGKDSDISVSCNKKTTLKDAVSFAKNRQKDKDRKAYSWNPLSPNHCKSFADEFKNAEKFEKKEIEKKEIESVENNKSNASQGFWSSI